MPVEPRQAPLRTCDPAQRNKARRDRDGLSPPRPRLLSTRLATDPNASHGPGSIHRTIAAPNARRSLIAPSPVCRRAAYPWPPARELPQQPAQLSPQQLLQSPPQQSAHPPADAVAAVLAFAQPPAALDAPARLPPQQAAQLPAQQSAHLPPQQSAQFLPQQASQLPPQHSSQRPLQHWPQPPPEASATAAGATEDPLCDEQHAFWPAKSAGWSQSVANRIKLTMKTLLEIGATEHARRSRRGFVYHRPAQESARPILHRATASRDERHDSTSKTKD